MLRFLRGIRNGENITTLCQNIKMVCDEHYQIWKRKHFEVEKIRRLKLVLVVNSRVFSVASIWLSRVPCSNKSMHQRSSYYVIKLHERIPAGLETKCMY